MFRFGVAGVEDAHQRGELVRARFIYELRLPAQAGRSNGNGSQRMTHIVLAITVSPLPILPRLAPMDRGQAEQQCALGQAGGELTPEFRGHSRPDLQRMLTRRIVCDQGRIAQPRNRAADQITLRRMQIAAGRIHPQRPPAAAILFPCRERQAIQQQLGDRVIIQRRGRNHSRCESGSIGRFGVGGNVRQWDEGRAGVAAEWIGLGRPIQIARPRRRRLERVLAELVIIEDHIRRVVRQNSSLPILMALL